MKSVMNLTSSLLLAVLVALAISEEAHAYLDAGSGSFFFQMIIASVVGALFSIKMFWNRILFSIRSMFTKPGKSTDK